LSSILKALKKIEEETPPPEAFPSLPQPINSKQALNSNTLKRRRVRKILIFLILLAAAGAAAGLLFSQHRLIVAKIRSAADSGNTRRSAVQTPPPTKIFKAKITGQTKKSTPLRPVPKVQGQNHAQKSMAGTGAGKYQTDQASFPSGSTAGQDDSKSSSLGSAAAVEPKLKVEKPLKKLSTPMRAAPAEKSDTRRENAPVEPVAAVQKKSLLPPEAAYDRIEDSKLKLQALAWSTDVARRMAVINGRIVHEGESVDGYQVIQIREEDVVVNDGGKSWRLAFGVQR